MAVAEIPSYVDNDPRRWRMSLEIYHALGDAMLLPQGVELLNGIVFLKDLGKVWKMPVESYQFLAKKGLISKNTELIEGTVYTKMSKSPLHGALIRKLAKMLPAACPPGHFVDSEQPITCTDSSEPEPDLCVVRGNEDDFWQSHPRTAELVIEVCVATQDRLKLRPYAMAGVQEVWFVFAQEKQIEVLRKPQGGEYRERAIFGPRGTVTSSAVPEFKVDLERLFSK